MPYSESPQPQHESSEALEALLFQASQYERNPRFRSSLAELARTGLAWIGSVTLASSALYVGIYVVLLGFTITWTYQSASAPDHIAVPTLLTVVVGSLALIGLRRRVGLQGARGATSIFILLSGTAVFYDGALESEMVIHFVALIYLIGVAAVPFRPRQVLALGGMLVGVAAIVGAFQPFPGAASQVAFTGVTTAALTGVSAILYRRHRVRIDVQTRLEESQQLIKETAEVAQVGGFSADRASRTVTWTDQVYEIFQADPAETPTVASGVQFYAPEARSTIREALERCFEGEAYDLELPVVTGEGTRRWVRTRGQPDVHDGEVTRIYGAIQDITERKKREQQLREAKNAAEAARKDAESAREEAERQRRRAEKASQSKSQFLAGIAHDLKTPVTSIEGFAELLDERLEGEDRTFAQTIHRSAQQIDDMAQSLLDIARLQNGHLDLDDQAVDLVEVADAVVEARRAVAQEAQIDLTLDAATEEVWGHGNTAALRRAVSNLVDNAIKYGRSGDDVTVTVIATAPENEAPVGRIVVEDTGPGIDPDFLDQLFDPFTRNAPGTDGTGLGLAVTKELVEAIDGAIEVDSTPGEGTRFEIQVPAHPTRSLGRSTPRECEQDAASPT